MKMSIVNTMAADGGTFERRLAALWFAADGANTNKLEAAFPDLFLKWEEIEKVNAEKEEKNG
jgi:hypothetical protein